MAKSKAPAPPPGSARQLTNGRWQDTKTGRILPEINGRPLAPGWRKDKRGRPYNVAARRNAAIRNFGRERKRGKAPAQGANLAKREGIKLWNGPPRPRPRNQTTYTNLETNRRIAADGIKAAALTRWVQLHGRTGFKPKLRNSGAIMGAWFIVTTARHATDWTSGNLGFYPKRNKGRGQWVYFNTTQLAETTKQARDLADEQNDKYPAPDLDGEKATDQIAIYYPIRSIDSDTREKILARERKRRKRKDR